MSGCNAQASEWRQTPKRVAERACCWSAAVSVVERWSCCKMKHEPACRTLVGCCILPAAYRLPPTAELESSNSALCVVWFAFCPFRVPLDPRWSTFHSTHPSTHSSLTVDPRSCFCCCWRAAAPWPVPCSQSLMMAARSAVGFAACSIADCICLPTPTRPIVSVLVCVPKCSRLGCESRTDSTPTLCCV